MIRFRRRRPRTREQAFVEIRAYMRALGWLVDDLTDEQIEEGCRKLSEAARAASMTTAQATAGLQRAFAAMPSAFCRLR